MTVPEEPKPDALVNLGNLLGGLDLTPEWARGTPGVQSDRPSRGDSHERRGDGPRAPRDSSRRSLQGVRVKPRRDAGFDGPSQGPGQDRGPSRYNDRGPDRGGDRGGYRDEPRAPRLPVHVDFIPGKTVLSKVVKLVRQTKRAFPMDEIAGKFMEDPRSISIKFTVKDKLPEGENLVFFQCMANGMVFTERAACEAYVLERGLPEYYESESRTVPPPAGNFPGIGRHRASGTLIGPPNWHGYQKRLEELRREIAPDTAPEDFASGVELVREEEVIAAWKEQVSQKTFYRRKAVVVPVPPAEEAPAEAAATEAAATEGEASVETPAESEAPAETEAPAAEPTPAAEYTLSREQAEAEFRAEVMPGLIHESRRAIMPGHLLATLSDPGLASAANFHLRRERTHPSSIIFALRPAFKHMRLHLFRHDGRMHVSGVLPHPLPTDQPVAAEIQRILDYIGAHPDCQAKAALLELSGGTDEPLPDLVSHVHWLMEKGHLIEFSNGTLSLPRVRPAGAKPDEE